MLPFYHDKSTPQWMRSLMRSWLVSKTCFSAKHFSPHAIHDLKSLGNVSSCRSVVGYCPSKGPTRSVLLSFFFFFFQHWQKLLWSPGERTAQFKELFFPSDSLKHDLSGNFKSDQLAPYNHLGGLRNLVQTKEWQLFVF